VILTADPVDDVVAQDEESPYIGLHDLIASLPERQRLVLFLRYYADMDYQAIAEILHIEMGTVGATLNKAYATLRRQLEEARHDELR
jgi:RNA polymerase sigma factor (sigma-70 family)